MATIIQPDVVDILKQSTIEGTKLYLPDLQLDRKLYQNVNEVLTNLGGIWNRKTKAHIFEENPTAKISAAIAGKKFINKKKEFELFETPESFASELVESIVIYHGDKALEPSAGNGRIAHQLKRMLADVDCIEIQEELATKLKNDGFNVTCADFLQTQPNPIYDVVVMNPPFSKGQDIKHVLHAWEFLKEGGNLVAIMSAGVEFKSDKQTKAFREFIDAHDGYFESNNAGTFKSSGTMVNTITLWLRK